MHSVCKFQYNLSHKRQPKIYNMVASILVIWPTEF